MGIQKVSFRVFLFFPHCLGWNLLLKVLSLCEDASEQFADQWNFRPDPAAGATWRLYRWNCSMTGEFFFVKLFGIN